MRRLVLALLVCVPSITVAQQRSLNITPYVSSEPRLALLIGNSEYSRHDALPRLPHPAVDAGDIGELLKVSGFSSVTVLADADFRTMREAIARFGAELRKAGRNAVGLFYFAGHGVERRGNNYLIPIGTRSGSPRDLESAALDAQDVLAHMEEAGNAVNIFFLDACRDDPFLPVRARWGQGGLVQMKAPRGVFIAYAAAPGQLAVAGNGRNSLFVQHLLAHLSHGDSSIDAVFARVAASVADATDRQQVPWKQSSLTRGFVFRPN